MSYKALVAIGGNSLIKAGERGSLSEQAANARETSKNIALLAKKGWELIITHGNGPQAGAQLLRSERASNEVYSHTLDMCVAVTQSEIGYILQKELDYQLKKAGVEKTIAVIPTMTLVDPNDPAFLKPSKPIGPFYDKKIAERKRAELGWDIIEDAARGYRRVVPSPEPKKILQLDVIEKAMELGIVAIALGGGGIPVVIKEDGKIEGVEAVIDKDRSSALLAADIGADIFIISTDADRVYLNFKKKNQKALKEATVEEMRGYLEEGHFPPGSMGPKVESAASFVEKTGKEAIITSYERFEAALEGLAGTRIVP